MFIAEGNGSKLLRTTRFCCMALRRALSLEAFLTVLAEHRPTHAAVLKQGQVIHANLGESNPWFSETPPL